MLGSPRASATSASPASASTSTGSSPAPLTTAAPSPPSSPPRSDAIVAMASSSESEFAAVECTRLERLPCSRSLWYARVAARVGERLAARLRDLGVDLDEELAHPPHHRRPLSSLFLSVQRSGIRVDGGGSGHSGAGVRAPRARTRTRTRSVAWDAARREEAPRARTKRGPALAAF